eukprot:g3794.t1
MFLSRSVSLTFVDIDYEFVDILIRNFDPRVCNAVLLVVLDKDIQEHAIIRKWSAWLPVNPSPWPNCIESLGDLLQAFHALVFLERNKSAKYLSSTSKPTNWRKKITNQQQTETQKIEQAQQDIGQNKKRLDSQESDVRKLSGGVDSLRQETKRMLQQLQDIKAQQQRTDFLHNLHGQRTQANANNPHQRVRPHL